MEAKLKIIAVTFLVVAIAALSAGAATADEILRQQTYPTYDSVSTYQIRKVTQFRIPPLVLPDIKGRVWKLSRAERHWLGGQLKKSQQVIAFFDNPRYRWVLAPRKEKCWEVPWQRQCTLARAKLKLHHELAEVAEKRLWFELPLTNDFVTGVEYAQRVFPNTKWITLSCADSEGGRGGWVPNRQGSGAGGWMQFMESTFWRMFYAAKAEAERKGFVIPREAASWYSPLGQALAGSWGMENRRSEWSGSGC